MVTISSKKSRSHKNEHGASVVASLWIAAAAIAIGLLYWWAATHDISITFFGRERTPTKTELTHSTADPTPASLTSAERTTKESLLNATARPVPAQMTQAQQELKRSLLQSTQ